MTSFPIQKQQIRHSLVVQIRAIAKTGTFGKFLFQFQLSGIHLSSLISSVEAHPVTLNSEMDFYLRNGRNGDFRYEMELQNFNFIHYIEKYFI